MMFSAVIAVSGIVVAWRLYSRSAERGRVADGMDPLEVLQPRVFGLLREKFFVDELYQMSVVRWHAWCGRAARWFDDKIWENAVVVVSYAVLAMSWVNRLLDEYAVNKGFDQSCRGVRLGGWLLSLVQNGQVQRYMRVIALALVIASLIFIWGCSE
jgi:NADH-quinone oxidoreductase subunit L